MKPQSNNPGLAETSAAITRFRSNPTAPAEVFDLALAGVLIDQQMARMNAEDIPGAVDWFMERHPEQWDEIRRLFWLADQACLARSMKDLRAALELFWDAWRGMLDSYLAEFGETGRLKTLS